MVLGARMLRRSCRTPCALFVVYAGFLLVVLLFVVKLPRDSESHSVVLQDRFRRENQLGSNGEKQRFVHNADAKLQHDDKRNVEANNIVIEPVIDVEKPKKDPVPKKDDVRDGKAAGDDYQQNAKPFEPMGPRSGKYGNKTLIIEWVSIIGVDTVHKYVIRVMPYHGL